MSTETTAQVEAPAEEIAETPQDTPEDYADKPASNIPTAEEALGKNASPAEKQLYKLIVDGVEEEHDLESLKKLASHGKGAAKRMTEASKLKDDTVRVLELLKQNPLAALRELQPDFNEKTFLSQKLAELMEDELATPEQRQAKQDALELAEYRKAKAKEKEDREALELKELADIEVKKLDEEFAQAFEEAGLPKTDVARRRLATLLLEAAENNQQIDTIEAAKVVKREMSQELMELLKATDDDAFEALLGSDLLTRAQKMQLKKVKHAGERTEPLKREKTTEAADKKKRMSADEFKASLGIF